MSMEGKDLIDITRSPQVDPGPIKRNLLNSVIAKNPPLHKVRLGQRLAAEASDYFDANKTACYMRKDSEGTVLVGGYCGSRQFVAPLSVNWKKVVASSTSTGLDSSGSMNTFF